MDQVCEQPYRGKYQFQRDTTRQLHLLGHRLLKLSLPGPMLSKSAESLRRSPLLVACLTYSAYLLWSLQGGLSIQMASSRDFLQTAIDLGPWRLHLPVGPWLLGLAGLVAAHMHLHFSKPRQAQGDFLCARLRHLLYLTGLLTVLRLLSLWGPTTYLFPYLTLLWSPHASWSLALVFVLYPLLPVQSAANPAHHRLRTGPIAALIFAICSLLFGLYAVYFCRVTMLHGDEAQYLHVTYSLLHDGDMDLSNNLGFSHTSEFHTRDFSVHKAPASPPGKVYSTHPIGLSVLLVPAYWFGLEHWQNPRLACALFMAVLTAACAALTFLWLARLDTQRHIALLTTGILASNAPIFFYSNQLYPEIPALLIILVVLSTLTHWQKSRGSHQPLKAGDPPALGALTLLLGLLPFLHPRYLPLTSLGILVLVQARHSARQRLSFACIGLATLLVASALFAFNSTFSGDWMGNFQPGNAWEGKRVIDFTTLAVSLPGQWLSANMGLANAAPVFLLTFWGWAILALEKDRRLLLAGGLYLASAGINGLNGVDWTMGFCYPARFMVVALPALLLGLNRALNFTLPRLPFLLLVAAACTIGLDTIWTAATLPELGYVGKFYQDRALSPHYPFDVHFSSRQDVALADLTFWLLALTSSFLALRQRSWSRLAFALSAALLPVIWGHHHLIDQRLDSALSPHTRLLPRDGDDFRLPPATNYALSQHYRSTVGIQQEDGRYLAAQPQHGAGVLTSFHLPIMRPGIYTLFLPDLQISGQAGQIPGHLIVTHRTTLPAVSDEELRLSQPLRSWSGEASWTFPYYIEKTRLGHLFVEFSGHGSMALDERRLEFLPLRLRAQSALLRQFEIENTPAAEGNIFYGTPYYGLEEGRYKANFSFSGSTLSTFAQRQPIPLIAAVYIGPSGSEVQRQALKDQVMRWFSQQRSPSPTIAQPDFLRPLAERVYPTWRILPFVHNACELVFTVDQKRDIWFIVQYDGEQDIHLEGISLHRLTYEVRP